MKKVRFIYRISGMKKCLVFLLLLIIPRVFAQQPSGTEIYLFDLSMKKNKITLSNPKNITNRPGYDNQPFFHPDEPVVYYSSADAEGYTDILSHNYRTGNTQRFTNTPEREYSPTVTPDKKFISCIIQREDGAQDLGKYPIGGGGPEILINNLTVGYHAWVDDLSVALFVLGQPNTLRWYSLKKNVETQISDNIGRSLHRIPGANAISFVDKSSATWRIRLMDGRNGAIEPIIDALPGQEDLAWTPDGKILMSDGEKIFFWHVGKSETWEPIEVHSPLSFKGITRMAVNLKGDKLAIVVNE
jgi:hypothetical protein